MYSINNSYGMVICNCCYPHSISAYHLRSCDQGLPFVPKTNRMTFGDWTFAHSGSLLWNKLPLDIRSSPNVSIFKSKLKTYLFKLA